MDLAELALAALLGDFLRLHCINDGHLLLFLLKVALLVLKTVLDDSFDDLFCRDGAAGVDGDEFLENFWYRVRISVFGRNWSLAMDDNINVELLNQLVGDVKWSADDDFVDILE